MKSLNGWKFDEMEGKSTATKKRISYPFKKHKKVSPFFEIPLVKIGNYQKYNKLDLFEVNFWGNS